MLSKNQSCINDPALYKKLISQIAEQSMSASRVHKQMDRFVGKTANDIRWKMMKRKYSLTSTSNSRKNSGSNLDPDIISQVQAKERQKMYSTSLSSMVGANKIKPPVRYNPQKKEFFNGHKKSLSYLQKQSPFYNKIKTQQKQLKTKPNKKNWYNYLQKKRCSNLKAPVLRVKFQHPALRIYKNTTEDVINCCRQKCQLKNPFDWFVSPFQLQDL